MQSYDSKCRSHAKFWPPRSTRPAQKGRKILVSTNFSKFIITSLFLGVLTWDRHHLKGMYFSGLQKMTCQNFAMTASRGSKLRSKVTKISKFRFYRKWLPNTPKSPKIKIKYFMWIHPFFQKNYWWIWINHISMESGERVLPKTAKNNQEFIVMS